MNLKKNILFLILLFLFVRFLFLYAPFWGLEYEDSFIYNDTGRFIEYSYNYISFPFQTVSCLDGSYVECYQYGSFSGHFITFPLILATVNHFFSYSVNNIFFLNLFFSFSLLIVGLIFLYRYAYDPKISVLLFISLFIVTPISPLFNTSGLAETVSSFFVFLFFLSICQCNDKDYKFSYENYIALISLLIAFLIKRENLILLFFILSMPFFRIYFKQKFINKNYVALALLSIALLTVTVYVIDLYEIESNEMRDIDALTFSIKYLTLNIKELLIAMSDMSYWGITGYLFVFAIIASVVSKNNSRTGLLALFLSLMYITMYCSHYRSYYQVVYGTSDPFETLRYSVTYLPLLFIFISSVNYMPAITRIKINISSKYNACVILTILLLLTLNTINTRIKLSKIEYYSRIKPVTEMLSVASVEDIIITDIPVVFHCYINENQRVIDVYTLTNERLVEITGSNFNSNIYYLENIEKINNENRYVIKFDNNLFKQITFDHSKYNLYKYIK